MADEQFTQKQKDAFYKKQHYLRNREKCIQRTREWRKSNRERYLEASKAYYQANKERLLKRSKEYQISHPEQRKETWTRWRKNNLDRAHEVEAAYRERNRDACNARISEWKKDNKGLLAFYSRRRQAALIRAVPAWADNKAIKKLYRKAETLRRDSGEDWHVDHIVPLISPLVCGLHCEANLRIVPGIENMKKNNRHWPDMP